MQYLHLKMVTYLFVEGLVVLLVFSKFGKKFETLFDDVLSDNLQDLGLLKSFTRDVEWKIFGVNNTLDEVQVFWNDFFTVIHDENTSKKIYQSPVRERPIFDGQVDIYTEHTWRRAWWSSFVSYFQRDRMGLSLGRKEGIGTRVDLQQRNAWQPNDLPSHWSRICRIRHIPHWKCHLGYESRLVWSEDISYFEPAIIHIDFYAS